MDPDIAIHPLDNPVWSSISGPHHHLSITKMIGTGGAGHYRSDVCPFGGFSDPRDPICWSTLAEGLDGKTIVLMVDPDRVPDSWEISRLITGVQMVGTDVRPFADQSLLRLDASDVPDMLDLVEQTRPGPFLARTIEMGTYLGLRYQGQLVAMAGQRLHPPGWREISAVCTKLPFQKQGLGSRLVRTLTALIRRAGEQPFLHVSSENQPAIRLYHSLGFRLRRHVSFTVVRTHVSRRPRPADRSPHSDPE